MNENVGLVSPTTANTPKVVPLLQALNRAEESVQALAMRLDPITNHTTSKEQVSPPAPTVTSRIHAIGDVLQYLLDNIEL